jgi:alpha-1,3-rhamnosyltransferase
MNYNQMPLVSVSVIVYNSSKTIVETMDSIYNQTYPNLELIVSDDFSTDNTVQVCCDWVKAHKDRFVRTELLTVEKNTGISANLNRAERACHGEWVKTIAGDDLLLPNCVSDYMDYVKNNPDAIYVFGKVQFFGSVDGNYSRYERLFDYSFFSLDPEKQLYRLIFVGNCVPASSCFYSLEKVRGLGLGEYDERILLLEDYPNWIRLLKKGIRFHFLDKEVVKYRINGISNGVRPSPSFFADGKRFELYYCYDEWRKYSETYAVERMVREQKDLYVSFLKALDENVRICNSKAYRIGKFLLKPFSWLRRCLS